jgi:hypothetical protein
MGLVNYPSSRASIHHSRFARTGIRPVSLVYPVSYPGAKTLVVGIAHDEESTANVGGTASVERMERNAMLIYAEE